MRRPPTALILAGPNGAAKTTVSSVFFGPAVEFVTADIIGADFRKQKPDRPGADVTAGRIVSARLRSLAADRRDFCFETNLASTGLVEWIDGWRATGYETRLIFVSLPNVVIALARVAARVAAGGHDVPELTVRRRFTSGLRNFLGVYRYRVDVWTLYDNSTGTPVLIAGGREYDEVIHDQQRWQSC